jgi:flagellar hook-associated protein 3 FlgL
MGTIRKQQAIAGARQAQSQRAEEANMNQSVSLEAQRSGIEDVDLAKIILDLQVQEHTYQAVLAVTSRVLQPTLMDFLSNERRTHVCHPASGIGTVR